MLDSLWRKKNSCSLTISNKISSINMRTILKPLVQKHIRVILKTKTSMLAILISLQIVEVGSTTKILCI